jgi:hypothetical protein
MHSSSAFRSTCHFAPAQAHVRPGRAYHIIAVAFTTLRMSGCNRTLILTTSVFTRCRVIQQLPESLQFFDSFLDFLLQQCNSAHTGISGSTWQNVGETLAAQKMRQMHLSTEAIQPLQVTTRVISQPALGQRKDDSYGQHEPLAFLLPSEF